MPIKNIDAATLKHWMDKGEAILVDVREPAEHSAGVIPGAILMPLGNVANFKLPDIKGKKVVMQCRSGARSLTAGEILLKGNPDLDIYNLAGGILEWAAAGHSIK